jgi:hypothetical protein
MKNLFKNKSFYLGLAATFAVAAGLYMAFPKSDNTNVADQTEAGQTVAPTVDSQPASNTGSTVESAVTKPAVSVNNQPAQESNPAAATDSVNKISADQD